MLEVSTDVIPLIQLFFAQMAHLFFLVHMHALIPQINKISSFSRRTKDNSKQLNNIQNSVERINGRKMQSQMELIPTFRELLVTLHRKAKYL